MPTPTTAELQAGHTRETVSDSGVSLTCSGVLNDIMVGRRTDSLGARLAVARVREILVCAPKQEG